MLLELNSSVIARFFFFHPQEFTVAFSEIAVGEIKTLKTARDDDFDEKLHGSQQKPEIVICLKTNRCSN